jgi:type IV pilus assembly protein PilV
MRIAMRARFSTPLSRSSIASGERGVFLLEALIAILIVSLGILGSVGLLARSMQNVDDAKSRGEAAHLASSYIGQMWIGDRTPAALDAMFSNTGGGAAYDEFKAIVQKTLPNAVDPTVEFTAGAMPTANTSMVTVTIFWQPPGDATTHQYVASATIGANSN